MGLVCSRYVDGVVDPKAVWSYTNKGHEGAKPSQANSWAGLGWIERPGGATQVRGGE